MYHTVCHSIKKLHYYKQEFQSNEKLFTKFTQDIFSFKTM